MKHDILVVDDEPEIRQLYEDFLEPEFKVYAAANGLEAMALLKQRSYAVVFTDYNMPGMNGLEFLIAMRENYYSAPVVIVTGRGSKEIEQRAVELGVFEYIEKPFTPDRLREVARKCRIS